VNHAQPSPPAFIGGAGFSVELAAVPAGRLALASDGAWLALPLGRPILGAGISVCIIGGVSHFMEAQIVIRISSPTADGWQNGEINSCRVVVFSKCFSCGSKVVGVPVRERPGCYSMECKECGRSAIGYYDRNAFFADAD
jgi:hypothetical protein